MNDLPERVLEPAIDNPVNSPAEGAPPEPELAAADWHADAGRKGAARVHQLIELGRRYEAEHGLKKGRQRLRQLIELGKRYEKEHELLPLPARERTERLNRADRDELLGTLLDCLLHVAKPSFRPQLERLVEALQHEEAGSAA